MIYIPKFESQKVYIKNTHTWLSGQKKYFFPQLLSQSINLCNTDPSFKPFFCATSIYFNCLNVTYLLTFLLSIFLHFPNINTFLFKKGYVFESHFNLPFLLSQNSGYLFAQRVLTVICYLFTSYNLTRNHFIFPKIHWSLSFGHSIFSLFEQAMDNCIRGVLTLEGVVLNLFR